MNVGNLVKIKSTSISKSSIGVIVDLLEGEGGWYHFEVIYTTPNGESFCDWFSDLQLEVLD